MIMDFYCREVWLYGDPACESYMLNLAAKLWWLDPTFFGWYATRKYWGYWIVPGTIDLDEI